MNRSNRLITLLGEVTHADLRAQVDFLRVENIILRKRLLHKRLYLTDEERNKILRYGLLLGPKIIHLISIVT